MFANLWHFTPQNIAENGSNLDHIIGKNTLCIPAFLYQISQNHRFLNLLNPVGKQEPNSLSSRRD
jgi:hypothetical protein